jgi:hypothetical protein
VVYQTCGFVARLVQATPQDRVDRQDNPLSQALGAGLPHSKEKWGAAPFDQAQAPGSVVSGCHCNRVWGYLFEVGGGRLGQRFLLALPRPAVSAGFKVPTVSSPPRTPHGAPRVIVCDYNALLHSVTGLLRMSGFAVFQAYDGPAAAQLCEFMPEIDMLILNTEGTGVDTAALVHDVRRTHPDLPVLHIGTHPLPGLPDNVPTLAETFTAEQLLGTVKGLLDR